MTFDESFPMTNCLWRYLGSRRVRFAYVSALTIVLIVGIALRVDSLLLQRRAVALVSALSRLKVGVTSKSEAVSLIPTLKANGLGPYGAPRCDADECTWTGVTNSKLSAALFLRATRTSNSPVYSALSFWGLRFCGLTVYVNFTGGKVSYVGYHLMVSRPTLDYSYQTGADTSSGTPGLVIVGVSSKHVDTMPSTAIGSNGSRYTVVPSRRKPDWSVGVTLSPETDSELARRAFAINLNCLWSLSGCRTWKQLLPNVQT